MHLECILYQCAHFSIIRKSELHLYLVDFATIVFTLVCVRDEKRNGRKPQCVCNTGYLNSAEVLICIRNLAHHLLDKYVKIQLEEKFVCIHIKRYDTSFFDLHNRETFEQTACHIKAPQSLPKPLIAGSHGLKRSRPDMEMEEQTRPCKTRRMEEHGSAVNIIPLQHIDGPNSKPESIVFHQVQQYEEILDNHQFGASTIGQTLPPVQETVSAIMDECSTSIDLLWTEDAFDTMFNDFEYNEYVHGLLNFVQ